MATKHDVRLGEAYRLARLLVPGYEVGFKRDSKLHRAIGWLLAKVGNPLYLEAFWTTVGLRTARPRIAEAGATSQEWMTILHEAWHAHQARRLGTVLMGLIYLFPLPLLALAPVLLLTGHWALALAALAAAAPLPALGRAWLEREAYQVSAALMYAYQGDLPESYIEGFLVEQFVGPNYYWMWPFRNQVRDWWYAWLHDLREGDLPEKGPLAPFLREGMRLAVRYRREDGLG